MMRYVAGFLYGVVLHCYPPRTWPECLAVIASVFTSARIYDSHTRRTALTGLGLCADDEALSALFPLRAICVSQLPDLRNN